jgi:hypothetical protein
MTIDYRVEKIAAPSESALLVHIRHAQYVSGLGGGREDAHVYFIQRGTDGPIKIGASTNVVRRLGELQIAAPETMRLIGVAILGGYGLESRLHRFHAADLLGGEWFTPTADVWETVRDLGWPQ